MTPGAATSTLPDRPHTDSGALTTVRAPARPVGFALDGDILKAAAPVLLAAAGMSLIEGTRLLPLVGDLVSYVVETLVARRSSGPTVRRSSAAIVDESAAVATCLEDERRFEGDVGDMVRRAFAEALEDEGRFEADVGDMVRRAFAEAADEDFEDGMESRFSRQLARIVHEYGNDGMEVVTYTVLSTATCPRTADEALRALGRMQHAGTYLWRRWLLERSLRAPSRLIRDGAALGLASMGDSHAIPYLEEAVKSEECAELREDLVLVLDDLRKVGNGAAHENGKKAPLG